MDNERLDQLERRVDKCIDAIDKYHRVLAIQMIVQEEARQGDRIEAFWLAGRVTPALAQQYTDELASIARSYLAEIPTASNAFECSHQAQQALCSVVDRLLGPAMQRPPRSMFN